MSEPTDDEAALVAAATAGDAAAFAALVEPLRPLMASVVRRIVRAEPDIDDVIQTALLRAWTHLSSFQGRSSFKSWLMRIATTTALNRIRDERPLEPIELEAVPSFTTALNTARLVAGQVWERALAALVHLPEKQRLVVELRLWHEMEFDEIAALADCTPGAARVHLHHGLRALREHLGELAPR